LTMSGSGSHDGDDLLPKRSSETSLEVSREQSAAQMSLSSDEVNYLVFRYVPTRPAPTIPYVTSCRALPDHGILSLFSFCCLLSHCTVGICRSQALYTLPFPSHTRVCWDEPACDQQINLYHRERSLRFCKRDFSTWELKRVSSNRMRQIRLLLARGVAWITIRIFPFSLPHASQRYHGETLRFS
jgi:hypothetical protein